MSKSDADAVNDGGRRDRMVIVQRWYARHFVALLAFAAAWNGFMVLWHVLAMSHGRSGMMWYGWLHTAAGVPLAYAAIAGVVNRTSITIRPLHLTVSHGPLPWPGSRRIAVVDVAQLFVVRHQQPSSRGGVHATFEVHVALSSGEEIVLVRGLRGPDEAREIERRVERTLGIEDHRVAGEFRAPEA